MLTVCYPSPPSPEVLAAVAARVSGLARIVKEPTSEAQMLIEGRPSREVLASMPNLRWMVVPFAGLPKATLGVMREIGRPIELHNLHHNSPETAELAVALLLAAAKLVVPMDNALRRNDWTSRYAESDVLLLEGRTALVLGLGAIGSRVARMCLGFGMQVLGLSASGSPREDLIGVEVHPASALEALLPRAEVLMICLPETAETMGLIGARELALMPDGSILVNIARAGIVEEEALYEALLPAALSRPSADIGESAAGRRNHLDLRGKLHSAGLDVWYRYPEAGSSVPTYYAMPESAQNTPPANFPFHELPNVVMSPHRAGVSMNTENRRIEHLARLINAAAKGEDVPNRVSLQAGY